MNASAYQEMFRDALSAGKRRDYHRSVQLLKSIIAETDSIPKALLYLGRSYHALEEHERAIRTFRQFIAVAPEESAGFFFLGRTYLSMEMPEYAIVYLKEAMKRNRDEPYIYGLLGLAYLKLKRSAIALKMLEEAVERAPEQKNLYNGYLNALTIQAIKLFQQGDLDMSGQMFRFLVKNGEKGILPHVYLALIERTLGNGEEALYHYDRALEYSPHDNLLRLSRVTLLFSTGKSGLAANEMEKLKTVFPGLEEIPHDELTMNKFMAIQFLQEDNLGKALFHAKQVLKAQNDPEMHMVMGEVMRSRGEYTKAFNHFQRVLEAKKSSFEAYYGIILTLWDQGEYRQILKMLNRLDRIDPNNNFTSYYRIICESKLGETPDTFIDDIVAEIRKSGPDVILMNTLGMEYIRSGYADLAEKWFLKSLTLNPRDSGAVTGLLHCYEITGDVKSLRKTYGSYLSMFPDDVEKRRDFIKFLVDRKEYKAAIDQILKYLPHRKNDKNAQKLLAFCYRSSGAYRDAAIIYRDLLKSEPDNKEHVVALVFCLERSGKIERAINFLQKAIEFFKPNKLFLLVLGNLYLKEEDSERSLQMFRKVLEMDEKEWRAYQYIGNIYKQRGMTDMAEKFYSHAERYRSPSRTS